MVNVGKLVLRPKDPPEDDEMNKVTLPSLQQTQKFEPYRSEAEHTSSWWSWTLPRILWVSASNRHFDKC